MKSADHHEPARPQRKSMFLRSLGYAVIGTLALASSAAFAATAGMAFRQNASSTTFLASAPLLDLRAPGLSLGVEHTLRLPSGAVVVRGPAYTAEAHAAAALAGGFNVPGFSVPSLHASWHSRSKAWRASLAVTDITRENLFANLADLSSSDANRLRLLPDRHWWFGLERRF